jgi:hypothetical protein
MKITWAISAAALLLSAGCVTMPEPVPEMYLMQKTPEQVKTLEKIENAIIAKNHEIRDLSDKVTNVMHTLVVEKGRLSILTDEKNLLLEKQKQYLLENDEVKLDESKKLLVDKEDEINTQQSRVDYTAGLLDYTTEHKDVAESELAVLVAELSYEKSQIAKAYLMKLQTAAGDDKGKKKTSLGAEKFDEKYKQYLDKQREILSGKRDVLDQASIKLKMAEGKLKKQVPK